MAVTEGYPGTRSARSEQIVSGSEAEYLTLRELNDNPAPVGCWRMRAVLHASGIEMSEATVGRLLKDLDSRGLTQSVGSKGRILAPEGRQRLAALEDIRRRWGYQDDLMQAVQAGQIKDILDLLIARRTVETETARLAAEKASDTDIQELREAVEAHRARRLGLGGKPDQNPVIHRTIARASGNRVLLALVNLLYEKQGLIETIFVIQRATRTLDPDEHMPLLSAIAAHNPDKAVMAMRAHFDRLIRVVERYGETHAGSQVYPASLETAGEAGK